MSVPLRREKRPKDHQECRITTIAPARGGPNPGLCVGGGGGGSLHGER